ncbi:MAG TPA: alpha/beta hydrolase-fold protein [Candidatus Babeliales bacterium]|jgi:S-formylglutathione hydrolase FrmB|nr:alpha/beta hydrolase-fold protein [Candidatus Babeliales bacterium]
MNSVYIFILFCTITIADYISAASRMEENGFVSNLVPRSPRLLNPLDQRRMFSIYLPDGYDEPGAQFPSIYYCPGLGGNDKSFNDGNKIILDDLISNDLMVPTIVVYIDPSLVTGIDPQDGRYKYQGSWYVDSALNGQFETYITTQLIPFVDAHYKTIPSGAFRAIMGQSMGGFGATFLGTRHPDLFCGFGSASGTPFWTIITDLASPGYAAYTLNSLILPEIPTSGPNAGKITPTNGVGTSNTFTVFSYAGAFSPNLTESTPFLAEYFVDLPVEVDANGFPTLIPGTFVIGNANNPCAGQSTVPNSLVLVHSVIDRWENFDPYLLMDSHVDTLARQAIYLDAGDKEAINNVGARLLSDKYAASLIDHEYILFEGGHIDCLEEETCSRHRTMFQLFSAKFSEAGHFPDDIRVKLIGVGTIVVQNGTWNINKGTFVGIETSPSLHVTNTNISIEIGNNGAVNIGDYTTAGGGLQIGNNFGKAILQGDPALINDTISGSITIDGTNALLQVGKQGFLGIGMGINGQAPTIPNFWSVSRLTNLINAQIIINKGTWIMNQIPNGQNDNDSIVGLGGSDSYTFSINPTDSIVKGGSSHQRGTDVWQLHPTLTNQIGLLPPSGVLTIVDPNPNAIDCFYLKPMGSDLFYSEALNREITATSHQYNDRPFSPKYAITTGSSIAFSDFLSADNYLQQVSKEGALTVDDNGTKIVVTYVDNDTIELVPSDQARVGVGGHVDFQSIAQTIATVGIWVETIQGKRELILVYDLNPA